MYGKFPKTVNSSFDSLFSEIFKISLLINLILPENFFFSKSKRTVSFSIRISSLGFFKIASVRFPVPGPTSRIFLFLMSAQLKFYLLSHYQSKNFDQDFFWFYFHKFLFKNLMALIKLWGLDLFFPTILLLGP